MLVFRPAVHADRDPVAAMVRARAEWMRDLRMPRWHSWQRGANGLGDRAADPAENLWILADGNTVVGCTALAPYTPTLGWTPDEREESALFLEGTVTHPFRAGQGSGILIAFATVALAAAEGRTWVRRGVLTDTAGANRGLVHYYRRQGWRTVRAVPHPRKPGITVWSLQRPAATHDPDLPVAIRGSATGVDRATVGVGVHTEET